jgi:group I intron endonuclease
MYIGSSVNVELRWRQHMWACKRGEHRSEKMQRAYGKYGAKFKFTILEECASDKLIRVEQQYMDLYKPKYNTVLDAENPMRSEESKAKALASIRTTAQRAERSARATKNNQAARMHTPEVKAKIKEALNTVESVKKRRAIAITNNSAAYMHTEEAKQKSREYRRSSEGRAALSKARDHIKKPLVDVVTGTIYESVMDAERKTGSHHSNIVKAIAMGWLCKGAKYKYLGKQ